MCNVLFICRLQRFLKAVGFYAIKFLGKYKLLTRKADSKEDDSLSEETGES